MAQQPDIQSILAALAAHQPSATPTQTAPVGQQQGGGYPGYPPPQPIPTPNSLPSYGLPQGLPQPNNSGNFDLSSIKPVNTGSVSFADAIAKARSIAAEKGVVYDAHRGNGGDPRSGGRPSYRSRSRSRSPRRDNNRDGFNPYRDERREGPRAGSTQYGRGRSRSPPRAARSIQSPQRGFQRDRSPAGGGSDENSEVIMIDSSLVGLVIGRQGENLRRVEQESGTRIQFVTPADHPGPQRQCRITGKPRQREDAKQEIYRIMDENQEKLGRDSSRGSGNNRQQSASKSSAQPALREGENSSQIMVPDRTVGLIIGRGGETIRDLQERSGCHINIVGQNKTVNGLRPVNLIGTLTASNMAKDLIMEIVESDTREGQAGGQGGGQYPPRAADHQGGGAAAGKITESIMVPSDAVGMIIGKGGETIREMQNSTSCKVNVSQASGADIEREISLVGTRQAIEAAKTAIWEKVDAVREKNEGGFSGGRRGASGGGGGAGGGRDDGDRYSQPQYGQQQPAYAAQQQYTQPYAQPQQPGAAAPAAAATDPNAAADPYAQYGGYQNYMAMWYAAVAAQGQQGQGAAQGGQQPPPMS